MSTSTQSFTESAGLQERIARFQKAQADILGQVRQDAELVEILSLVEVDSPIPLEAFTAVAEILAFVYQANALKKPRPPLHAKEQE